MPAVDQNGLRDGRVCHIHGGTPLFVVFAHVHEFGDVWQIAFGQPGRLCDGGAIVFHILRDTGAFAALPFEILLDGVKLTGDGVAAGHVRFPLSPQVIALPVGVVDEILRFLLALPP